MSDAIENLRDKIELGRVVVPPHAKVVDGKMVRVKGYTYSTSRAGSGTPKKGALPTPKAGTGRGGGPGAYGGMSSKIDSMKLRKNGTALWDHPKGVQEVSKAMAAKHKSMGGHKGAWATSGEIKSALEKAGQATSDYNVKGVAADLRMQGVTVDGQGPAAPGTRTSPTGRRMPGLNGPSRTAQPSAPEKPKRKLNGPSRKISDLYDTKGLGKKINAMIAERVGKGEENDPDASERSVNEAESLQIAKDRMLADDATPQDFRDAIKDLAIELDMDLKQLMSSLGVLQGGVVFEGPNAWMGAENLRRSPGGVPNPNLNRLSGDSAVDRLALKLSNFR